MLSSSQIVARLTKSALRFVDVFLVVTQRGRLEIVNNVLGCQMTCNLAHKTLERLRADRVKRTLFDIENPGVLKQPMISA